MLTIGWSELRWGDVPTWVGSILTGAAFLIAAFAYRKSVRDSQRDQAKAVTVWVEEQAAEGGLFHRLTYTKSTLHIKNSSSATVYSVTVYYRQPEKEKPTFQSPYYDDNLLKLASWASLGPGEERSETFERYKLGTPQIPWVYFRDANGVDWIRDYRARLERHNYWLMRFISETFYLGNGGLRLRLRTVVIYIGITIYDLKARFYGRAQPPESSVENTRDSSGASKPQSQVQDRSRPVEWEP